MKTKKCVGKACQEMMYNQKRIVFSLDHRLKLQVRTKHKNIGRPKNTDGLIANYYGWFFY